MGKVDELLTGNDGVIRGVKLITNNQVVRRPLNKLIPLELTKGSNDRPNVAFIDESNIPCFRECADT